jgi:hypothetical protein
MAAAVTTGTTGGLFCDSRPSTQKRHGAESINKSLRKQPKVYLWDWSTLPPGGAQMKTCCNLVKQVHEFKTLVPAIAAELPEHYVEQANLE